MLNLKIKKKRLKQIKNYIFKTKKQIKLHKTQQII